MKRVTFVAALFLGGWGGDAYTQARMSRADWVWWEAEAPKATNFPEQNPFAPADQKAASWLSGGKWIGAAHSDKPLFLEYEVKVPARAEYKFFARKFWSHGPFRWRFDDQPWRACGRDAALLDDVSLAESVNANWVALGPVKLEASNHVLRIELPPNTDAVAFDAFLLTSGPFLARGKLKPGERYGVAPDGWFPFEPDLDPFGTAALDLRSLNEKFSGEGGFIQARGDSFVHGGTGQPVRFWAINAGFEILAQDGAAFDRFARHLAKVGVNMVRLQGPLWHDDELTKVDEEKLAKLHRLVAALKREGIYLALSSYWAPWVHPKGDPGFAGFTGDQIAFAVPFFNRRFQETQKGLWRSLLTAKNPHTGMTLLEDPTLAFFEILNEDGVLFWTFSYDRVPAAQMELAEKQFGQWLTTKYGTIDQAFAKWSGANLYKRWYGGRIKGDDPKSGRVGFLPFYDLLKRPDARAQDTATFLAELQRRYYDQMYAYLKNDLGFRGSVTGSNWITADAGVLGPLDKWSNAGCDFMDRHGYYGGPHEGPHASYLLSKGDRYNDASALLFATGKPGDAPSFELPIMDLAYNSKPSVLSEFGWVPPNRYRADMAVLAAAYGALQGSDGFFFFQSADIDPPQRLTKFSISDPVVMGQFPATALIFRKGLVKTAEAVAHVETSLANLYALKGIPIASPTNLDEFRRKDVPDAGPADAGGSRPIDPRAFLAGRVEVNVSEAGGPSKIMDLGKLIDRPHKTIRSSTGELLWDYGRGLATIDAPSAQGVTGFLANAGSVSLADVTIESPMDYGSIVLVSLDDQPLKSSSKMLLQVMSEDSNFGWSAPGTGMRPIVDVGGPPIVVKKLEGRIVFKRPDVTKFKVTPLDANGYAGARAQRPEARTVTFLPATFYYIIER